jgi:hypothetical protein
MILAINTDVQRFIFLIFLCGCVSATEVRAEGLAESKSRFYYKNTTGKTESVRIIHRYWRVPIVLPLINVDSSVDPKPRRAATIAEERANARSKDFRG